MIISFQEIHKFLPSLIADVLNIIGKYVCDFFYFL